MKSKLYNSMVGCMLAILFAQSLFAQVIPAPPVPPVEPVIPQVFLKDFNLKLEERDLKLKEKDLKLKEKDLKKLNRVMADISIKVADNFKGFDKKFEFKFDDKFTNDFSKADQKSGSGRDDNYIQGAEKIKVISKTYSADSKDKLSVSNQYGKITVNVWTKKEIKVEVEIKAYESSDDKAQDLLDEVSIAESRSGNVISFKTNIERNNTSWWSHVKNGKEERRGVQVNYTIYMPSKNPLDISNRYGSTTLPDFDGPVNINSSYGSLTAQKLDNPANRVKVSYGSADIENFSNGNLDVSYGSLKLTNADKLNADIRYSSAKIDRLTNSGNLDVSYTGGFKINEVDKNVKNLVINSSYSSISLGIDNAASFDFDVTVSYAGFNYDDEKVNITSKTPEDKEKGWNPTKNYKGHFGKGSDSRVIIKSNYGGVKFF
jgi:hypothetical protein